MLEDLYHNNTYEVLKRTALSTRQKCMERKHKKESAKPAVQQTTEDEEENMKDAQLWQRNHMYDALYHLEMLVHIKCNQCNQ